MQRSDYKASGEVDIWFGPSHKNQRGWRGPAIVRSVQPDGGNITVLFQGQPLDRRTQEVQQNVAYLSSAAISTNDYHYHLRYLQRQCSQQVPNTLRLYGLQWTSRGWMTSSNMTSQLGRGIRHSAMIVANAILHLSTC